MEQVKLQACKGDYCLSAVFTGENIAKLALTALVLFGIGYALHKSKLIA